MKRLVLIAAMLSGCSQQAPQNVELLCECFAEAAFNVEAVKSRIPAPDAPKGCCPECKKTPGRVLSGDGIQWVECPCPPSCVCKKAGLARPLPAEATR